MEEYQVRMVQETKELATKLNKLNLYMSTRHFYLLPSDKKDLLYEQSRVMSQYLQILGKRLELENAVIDESFW
jgi:hypothetical protein